MMSVDSLKSKETLKILISQINTVVGDFNANQTKVRDSIKFARQNKIDLVTFPELTLTGYPPEDLLFNKAFIDENLKSLHRIVKLTDNIGVIIGFVDRDKDGALYNAAALISNKKIIGIYHKTELPNYGVFDERRYFSCGDRPGIFNFKKIKIAISICEDIWQKDSWVYQSAQTRSAKLLINISASPYHRQKHSQRQALVTSLAKQNRQMVIYHNLVGGQDELVFDGGSLVANQKGDLISQAKSFHEDFLAVSFPPASLKNHPTKNKISLEEEVYQALLLGTKDYAHKNHFKKVVLGLSGGIDSALVACIAVDALGKENVIGVTMPSEYTSSSTLKDAHELSRRLGIRCLEFSIHKIFSSYLETLNKIFSGYPKNIAEENLQARIRGTILMALSNKFGYLVLTTGNKSEVATGYCTLYGDMAGGFAVIKDIPKTLVYKLSNYRNSIAPHDLIPQSIIKRAPTAELRPNQKDQDSLPPYAVLDTILEDYIENTKTSSSQSKNSKKLFNKIVSMVDRAEYKRRQSPPGIKITPKAFGRDRRMPITNRYTIS